MSFINGWRNSLVGAWAGASIGANGLRAAADAAEESSIREGASSRVSEVGPPPDPLVTGFTKVMEGAFAELELAFEDVGWRGIGSEYGYWNFTRATLRRITGLSRVMYLINPLIKRAVTVQELYVWGRGVKAKGECPEVDEVLQDFLRDRKNQRVIGASWAEREREQRIDGNTFFVFYLNKLNGTARVRLLPFDQIENIVFNPDDAKEPWLYARVWSGSMNFPGLAGMPDEKQGNPGTTQMYYPDIDYEPISKPAAHTDGVKIDWNTRVYHVKTGGLSMMRFGIPELFSILNWATGYKKILENFATILAAYARLAMAVSGLPGKKGVAATKKSMQTGVAGTHFRDNNPPNNTAGWAMLSGNVDIKPIKTAGSTTGPDEARALRSMVAAGSDTPEHFFGDSDVGNFATSTTLDRPTELKMISRQKMWVDIIDSICQKLIEWSAKAPYGKLHKAGYSVELQRDSFDGTVMITVIAPEGKNTNVAIEFPNILERDVTDRVRSVVQAVTLGGSNAEGIIPNRKLVCQLLLEALGEQESERLTELLYPDGDVLQGFIDPDNMTEDQRLVAQGKKEVGDAAILQAKVAKQNADKPTPKPSGAPAKGANNR